jgi:intracellular sulfur oxidation DsrE/DsrF family protein
VSAADPDDPFHVHLKEFDLNQYLFIQSRDSFAHASVAEHAELAIGLKKAGHAVTVFLVQNAVLPARADARHAELARLQDARVTVLADDFSLRERGIDTPALMPGVEPAPIDFVVDRMLSGWTVIWH